MDDLAGRKTDKGASRGFLDAYLAPLQSLLDDPQVIEIAINADGGIWVERMGDAWMTRTDLPELPSADKLGGQIAGAARLTMSDQNPIASARMFWKRTALRAQVVLPPACDGGTSITLRKYVQKRFRIDDIAYLDDRTVSPEEKRCRIRREIAACIQAQDLSAGLRLCVDRRLNVLVSGGTSTGKTTAARAMIAAIGPGERLLTIEDAVELNPDQPNTVRLVADRAPGSARSTDKLLQSAMRMRPDRIIVGELRGDEAFTFLEAINTGHGGSMSTIHAETAEKAIDRIVMLVISGGIAMPYTEIQRYVRSTIDVIVQLDRTDGKRGVAEVFMPGIASDEIPKAPTTDPSMTAELLPGWIGPPEPGPMDGRA